jgi:hypothetical protein
MSDEIRVNSGMSGASRYDNSSKGGKFVWIILGLVAILIIIGAVLFRDKLFSSNSGAASIGEGYQAVFLTNGQVYFGKMGWENKNYATLTDIYYLQVTQPPLQGSQEQGQQAQAQPQIQLVKLGNELHGPEDKMHITRDHILFYEDIKEDGKVSQAIKDYKANPQGTTQGTGTQRANPAPAQPAAQPAPAQPAPQAQPAPATQTPPAGQ